MKTYEEMELTAPRIFSPDTRWKWVVSFTIRGCFTPKERASVARWIGGWVGARQVSVSNVKISQISVLYMKIINDSLCK